MRFTTTIASAAVAGILGLAGVSVAGAAANHPSAPSTVAVTGSTPSTTKGAPARHAGKKHAAALRRRIRRGAGAVIAKTIGISRADLRQELASGKTFAAIATAHGVQPQAVIDALNQAAKTKIDAAVAAHKITAARAAKLQQRHDAAIPK